MRRSLFKRKRGRPRRHKHLRAAMHVGGLLGLAVIGGATVVPMFASNIKNALGQSSGSTTTTGGSTGTSGSSGNGSTTSPTLYTPSGLTVTASGLTVTISGTLQSIVTGTSIEWGDNDSNAVAALPTSHTYTSGGSYTISVTVTDADGDTAFYNYTNVSVTAPSSPAPTLTPSLSWSPNPFNPASQTSVTASGSGFAANSTVKLSYSGGNASGYLPASITTSSNGTWTNTFTYPGSGVLDGIIATVANSNAAGTITFVATDSAGNMATASLVISAPSTSSGSLSSTPAPVSTPAVASATLSLSGSNVVLTTSNLQTSGYAIFYNADVGINAQLAEYVVPSGTFSFSVPADLFNPPATSVTVAIVVNGTVIITSNTVLL